MEIEGQKMLLLKQKYTKKNYNMKCGYGSFCQKKKRKKSTTSQCQEFAKQDR